MLKIPGILNPLLQGYSTALTIGSTLSPPNRPNSDGYEIETALTQTYSLFHIIPLVNMGLKAGNRNPIPNHITYIVQAIPITVTIINHLFFSLFNFNFPHFRHFESHVQTILFLSTLVSGVVLTIFGNPLFGIACAATLLINQFFTFQKAVTYLNISINTLSLLTNNSKSSRVINCLILSIHVSNLFIKKVVRAFIRIEKPDPAESSITRAQVANRSNLKFEINPDHLHYPLLPTTLPDEIAALNLDSIGTILDQVRPDPHPNNEKIKDLIDLLKNGPKNESSLIESDQARLLDSLKIIFHTLQRNELSTKGRILFQLDMLVNTKFCPIQIATSLQKVALFCFSQNRLQDRLLYNLLVMRLKYREQLAETIPEVYSSVLPKKEIERIQNCFRRDSLNLFGTKELTFQNNEPDSLLWHPWVRIIFYLIIRHFGANEEYNLDFIQNALPTGLNYNPQITQLWHEWANKNIPDSDDREKFFSKLMHFSHDIPFQHLTLCMLGILRIKQP